MDSPPLPVRVTPGDAEFRTGLAPAVIAVVVVPFAATMVSITGVALASHVTVSVRVRALIPTFIKTFPSKVVTIAVMRSSSIVMATLELVLVVVNVTLQFGERLFDILLPIAGASRPGTAAGAAFHAIALVKAADRPGNLQQLFIHCFAESRQSDGDADDGQCADHDQFG